MKEIEMLLAQIEQVVLSKPKQVRLALACLLADGHILLEDLPGMGKTTLATCLAQVFDLPFNRLQLTSDVLPSDVLGCNIFNSKSREFEFKAGPVFCSMLLADELNRATPKAQSALLQAMEESTVSIDGIDHALSAPFFVIATQNPLQQGGTYPLPESQLDRFLIQLSLGYPESQAERKMLAGGGGRNQLQKITTSVSVEQLLRWQQQVKKVQLSESILDYIQALIASSRTIQGVRQGLSPRGALALVSMAKAWAFLNHRNYVVPNDVKIVFKPVAAHRITVNAHQSLQPLLDQILDSVVAF